MEAYRISVGDTIKHEGKSKEISRVQFISGGVEISFKGSKLPVKYKSLDELEVVSTIADKAKKLPKLPPKAVAVKRGPSEKDIKTAVKQLETELNSPQFAAAFNAIGAEKDTPIYLAEATVIGPKVIVSVFDLGGYLLHKRALLNVKPHDALITVLDAYAGAGNWSYDSDPTNREITIYST